MMDLLIINPSIYWLDWLRTVFESEGLNGSLQTLVIVIHNLTIDWYWKSMFFVVF